MKLPPDALIALDKIERYLLQWRPEDDKSSFLGQAGYGAESAEQLMNDIRSQLLTLEAELVEQSEYGPKFRIRGTLTGPNGHRLRVVSIWMTDEGLSQTKFITLYPDKS